MILDFFNQLASCNRLLQFFWLPIVFFAALFFIGLFVAYPIALKRKLHHGVVWIYIPRWWEGSQKGATRFLVYAVSVLFFALSVLSATFVVSWAVALFLPINGAFGLLTFPLWIVVAWLLFKTASERVFYLERDTYLLLYRRTVHAARIKALRPSQADIESRTAWELQKKLLRAEEKGILLRYLRAAAATHKFPENMQAEGS